MVKPAKRSRMAADVAPEPPVLGPQTQFADLKSYRLICDLLDVKSLSAFADTCQAARDAAIESFEQRQITTIKLGPEDDGDKKGVVATQSSLLFKRMLRNFGHMVTAIYLSCDGKKSQRLCDNVARFCGGTLESLEIYGKASFRPKCVYVERLFANLITLKMHGVYWRGPLYYVYIYKDYEHYLGKMLLSGLTFPRLQTFHGAASADFILRHQQLTDIYLRGNFQRYADALVALPDLQKLKVDEFDARDGKSQRLAELRHLRELEVTSLVHGDIGVILGRSDALIESLDVLKLRSDSPYDWPKLEMLKGLRELEVMGECLVDPEIETEEIGHFVTHSRSNGLKSIKVEGTIWDPFDKALYERADKICQRRGIALTFVFNFAKDEDNFGELFDRAMESLDERDSCVYSRGYIFLGKHDRLVAE